MTEIESAQAVAAHEWESRFLSRIDGMARQWVLIGKEVQECCEKRYFRELGHASFEAWIRANKKKLGRARATVKEAQRLFKELSQHISLQDMEEIPRANAHTLIFLPPSGRKNAEILALAKVKHNEEFAEACKAKYPSSMRQEIKVRWGWYLDKSLADALDELLEAAMDKRSSELPAQTMEVTLKHYVECDEVEPDE